MSLRIGVLKLRGSAVPPEWPQGLNKAFLPWLGMRVDPHNQSQRDFTESKRDLSGQESIKIRSNARDSHIRAFSRARKRPAGPVEEGLRVWVGVWLEKAEKGPAAWVSGGR